MAADSPRSPPRTRRLGAASALSPVRGLGRFLGFGLAGALMGSLGIILLLLGALRLLQTETGSAFQGRRTWIPYLLVVIVSTAFAGGVLKAGRDRRRDK